MRAIVVENMIIALVGPVRNLQGIGVLQGSVVSRSLFATARLRRRSGDDGEQVEDHIRAG